MRKFFGGKVDSPGAQGQVLPDARAYAILDADCRRTFAEAFLLYKLYGEAAAFTGG